MANQVVTGTPQVLVADGLSNTFDGARFQFEDLQLTVCRGQKLGLVGINGCGKSTLLKVQFFFWGGVVSTCSSEATTTRVRLSTSLTPFVRTPSFQQNALMIGSRRCFKRHRQADRQTETFVGRSASLRVAFLV